MSSRVQIPVTKHDDPMHQRAADNLRLHVESITGQNRSAEPLAILPANAALSDVITALNIIIKRLGN